MSKDELMERTDQAIQELVYPKFDLMKAYNYYNGVRDKDQFRYLEEMYGMGTPTSLNFTPLIKKHIDVLIGEYLNTPIVPKVVCKDKDTISNIDRERQMSVMKGLRDFLRDHLKNDITAIGEGKDADPVTKKQLDDIVHDMQEDFVSQYEIAAQDVLQYVMQSRSADIMHNLRDLLFDLLVTGYTFYRVTPTTEGNNIRIKVLNPLNTFIDRNYDSPYVRDSYRAVIRTWMTSDQIMNLYGKDLSKEDREIIESKWSEVYETAAYYARLNRNHCNGRYGNEGILSDVEAIPGYPDLGHGSIQELIPVYEVEWTETDRDYVMQRYRTVRIGDEIYICYGKDEDVIRSISNPSYCGLTVNGVYLLNRGLRPFSLVLACAHMQDQYDLLNFYRDNLLANSGTIGDWIDYTLIPAELGVNLPERILKWQALKKQGMAVIDSAQEGRLAAGAQPLNTTFNGYDNTVKAQAVQAIQLAMESIESTVSSITGVFRERLNGIQQYDAVSNVEVGQRNSFIVTKQYNHQMDLIVNEMLLDCLNVAKSVFRNGLEGTLVLGDKYQRIFTALPEHFTVSDHDIRIVTSSDTVKDLEQIKAIIPQFIQAGGLPPDIILEAVTCRSVPDLKAKVKRAMALQKKENDRVAKLTQQVQQMQLQMQKAQQKIESQEKKIQGLNEEKLKIEKEEVEMKMRLEWFKANTDREYREKIMDEAKRRTELEIQQLNDGNGNNDTIRKIKDI